MVCVVQQEATKLVMCMTKLLSPDLFVQHGRVQILQEAAFLCRCAMKTLNSCLQRKIKDGDIISFYQPIGSCGRSHEAYS